MQSCITVASNGFYNTRIAQKHYNRSCIFPFSRQNSSVRTAAATEEQPQLETSPEAPKNVKPRPRRPQKPPPSSQASRRKPTGVGFGTSLKSSSSDEISEEKKPAQTNPAASAPARAASSGVSRLPAPKEPVIKPKVDEKSKLEIGVVVFLAVFIFVIILEGIVLASSGFLPEEWDNFVVKRMYPSYTPTIGVFFACVIVYGAYKFYADSKNEEKKE